VLADGFTSYPELLCLNYCQPWNTVFYSAMIKKVRCFDLRVVHLLLNFITSVNAIFLSRVHETSLDTFSEFTLLYFDHAIPDLVFIMT
jgi:hypothetical protein